MPYIKVDPDKIDEYQQNVCMIRQRVDTIKSQFSDAKYGLDYDLKNRNGIERDLQNIDSSLSEHRTVLQRTNTFLGNTSLRYLHTEQNLYTKDQVFGAVEYTTIDETPVISSTESNYSEAEEKEIVALAAAELNISESDINESLSQGSFTVDDIVEFIEGKAEQSNKFVQVVSMGVKLLTGSSKVLFTVKDGYVVVSKFTRDSFFNNLVKKFNDGTGLGTRYKPSTIKGTPVVGAVYTINQIADKVDKVVNVVTAVTAGVGDVISAGQKISDIWADDTLTKKEKIIDTAAVGITSAIGTALDVAAPFAGTAVQSAVSTALGGALSVVMPGVGTVIGVAAGYVAGQIVENGMRLVSDVITSEAVVNQVSDSIEKVGDAVSSGVSAVSNAAKELKESKNAAEAVVNTAKVVGTAVSAGVKVAATAVVESTKVATKVVVETVKTVVNEVANTVQKAATAVKNFFKKW